ncbi:MAG: hypothetical protein V4525_14145 [Pseudomonadota bacterium]
MSSANTESDTLTIKDNVEHKDQILDSDNNALQHSRRKEEPASNAEKLGTLAVGTLAVSVLTLGALVAGTVTLGRFAMNQLSARRTRHHKVQVED